MFMEASIEPANTLGKDILPRFQKTPQYQNMTKRIEYLETPVTAHDLPLPPPESDAALTRSLLKEDGYNYTLKV